MAFKIKKSKTPSVPKEKKMRAPIANASGYLEIPPVEGPAPVRPPIEPTQPVPQAQSQDEMLLLMREQVQLLRQIKEHLCPSIPMSDAFAQMRSVPSAPGKVPPAPAMPRTIPA